MTHYSCTENSTGVQLNPIEALYLDYLNNYLSVEKFASDLGISRRLAESIIIEGRDMHNEKFRYGV